MILGYVHANKRNSELEDCVTTNTLQTITEQKTFETSTPIAIIVRQKDQNDEMQIMPMGIIMRNPNIGYNFSLNYSGGSYKADEQSESVVFSFPTHSGTIAVRGTKQFYYYKTVTTGTKSLSAYDNGYTFAVFRAFDTINAVWIENTILLSDLSSAVKYTVLSNNGAELTITPNFSNKSFTVDTVKGISELYIMGVIG